MLDDKKKKKLSQEVLVTRQSSHDTINLDASEQIKRIADTYKKKNYNQQQTQKFSLFVQKVNKTKTIILIVIVKYIKNNGDLCMILNAVLKGNVIVH